jgi:hypothetical protein
MSFLVNVVGNIVANAAFWLILGAGVWLASKASQARFARFFGTGDTGRIVVVLSNMWRPSASGRAVGYSISKHESLAAQRINALLAAAPMRLPELARGLVDTLWLRARIDCLIEVSPPPAGGVLEIAGTLVVVGGSARNSLRSRHLDQGLPRAAMEYELAEGPARKPTESREVAIRRGSGDVQRISSHHGVAVVEKAILRERGQTVFYCAGPRGDSTWIATEYLVRHWRRLAREFGDEPFVVCLGVPLGEQYVTEYHEPTVLASIIP